MPTRIDDFLDLVSQLADVQRTDRKRYSSSLSAPGPAASPGSAQAPSVASRALSVINLATSEILSTHDIDPDENYWRNTQKAPSRWPRAL